MYKAFLKRILSIFILALLFFLNFYFYGARQAFLMKEIQAKESAAMKKRHDIAAGKRAKRKLSENSPGARLKAGKIPSRKVKIAIIIDDFGLDYYAACKFMKSDLNLTLAVLPFHPNSGRISVMAKEYGKEVILHLPMEPENEEKGEAIMIRTSMEDKDIRDTIEKSLNCICFVKGVNNHQGSKATSDKRVMKIVLEELKKRNLYFVDSLTGYDSMAGDLAGGVGISFAQRDVFLDNMENLDYIKGQLQELIRIAQKKGKAIGIGHAYPNTLRALEEFRQVLEAEGVELVFMKDMFK